MINYKQERICKLIQLITHNGFFFLLLPSGLAVQVSDTTGDATCTAARFTKTHCIRAGKDN
jgi:hypothetical protein